MNAPFFFGYGSLVNRSTHIYDHAHPARIRGWRRAWRHTELRDVAFLTAVPDPAAEIDGLIAAVPGSDWQALDDREHGYDRLKASDVFHPVSAELDVHIYAIAHDKHGMPSDPHPILLSYLDVVVQGYLREFGEDGVTSFFESTDGWSAPIHNDRDDPRYSRHQPLSSDERTLVDDHLALYRRA